MVTREELARRVNEQGKQRASLALCMTCWHAAERHVGWHHDRASLLRAIRDGWDANPAEVLARDVHGKRRELLNREMRVIGLLVEEHREEFEEAMAGLEAAPSLGAARAKKAVKRAYRQR